MIKEEKYSVTDHFHVFRVHEQKFSELLKAFEVNLSEDYITLFTKIEDLPKDVGVIYIEKSTLEAAYEEFLKTTLV